jgi:hypothetical protein
MSGASTEERHLPSSDPPDAAPSRRATGVAAPASSPAIGARELWCVVLAAVALAILTSWPLVLHLSSRISPDLGDPVRTAWQIAWVGHALLHNPTGLFSSNAFYPHPLSLAFSDSLLGYGPTAFLGSGTVAALVRYNLLFLLAWSLCFIGAYLLARELGLRRLGASAAGIAFAYAPYRITEAGHLHVISSGGIPLALFLLLRGYRRHRGGMVLAGWLVSAWQISLGFTLGLQYSYLLLVCALLLLAGWLRAGRPPPARRLALVTCVGIAILGAITIYQARPYLKVAADYQTAKRPIHEVERYSSGPAALLAASSENRIWGGVTASLRDDVSSKNESVFFPGLAILVLALIGLAWSRGSPYGRGLRLGLAAGIVVCSVLAMGLGLTGAGYPYRLLYDFAPGWNGVRVPGRLFTLATLFYALLAGAGAQWLYVRVRSWSYGERLAQGLRDGGTQPNVSVSQRALPALLGLVIVLGLLGEGAGHLGHPSVPAPAKAEVGLAGPVMDLPTDPALDRVWQYFSTNGFYKIPLGNSTFDLPRLDDLRGGMAGFPDKASVEKLRFYHIKTVVLHTQPPQGLPPEHDFVVPEPTQPALAADKPVAGLGITRRRVGTLEIYEIGPGPALLHGSD